MCLYLQISIDLSTRMPTHALTPRPISLSLLLNPVQVLLEFRIYMGDKQIALNLDKSIC